MVIDCPDCNKKFDIDENLIPANGRLLQCGSCNYKWFFELKINKDIKPPKNILPENTETIIQEAESGLKKKIDKDIPEKINKKKVRNNVNYLNVFFVMLLSTVAPANNGIFSPSIIIFCAIKNLTNECEQDKRIVFILYSPEIFSNFFIH